MSAFNNAVGVFQSLFTDQVTAKILFRYSNTLPDGSAIPAGSIARSNFVIYGPGWASYIATLTADAKSSNDATAIANFPATPQSSSIRTGAPAGRAQGRGEPGVMCADSSVPSPAVPGCDYDGIVTVVSGFPFSFTRPLAAGTFDAQRLIEHEIDEVLGTSSGLNLANPIVQWRPIDLFSYSAAGTRNVTSSGSRYLSIDGGTTNIVGLNQNPSGDFGDWLSPTCTPAYVQNAFNCKDQIVDITLTSPEGILLDVIGFDPAITTAANVPISGRVLSSNGVGVRSARVVITDSRGHVLTALTNASGYYTFTSVPSGDTYIANATSRGMTFAPRVVSVNDALANVDLVAR